MTNQDTATASPDVATPDSIEHWRGAVYFESLALWKEKDPQLRANIARQLAEWSQILATLEAEAAAQAAQPPSPDHPSAVNPT